MKTEYAGNKIYRNGTLSMLLTEEGYVTLSGSTPAYHYYLRDHQGNNREVMAQNGTVLQVNHYYPFGGLFGEGMQTVNQPYKYNGKEFDRRLGLNMYDYGARHYDAATGRWFNVDLLTEVNYSISPFVYTSNNPVNRIDPTGMLDDWVENAFGRIYWNKNATSNASTKEGETYLGKNVLVATHNRDANLNEPINSATFELYLESNHDGPSATISGNTVPADGTTSGTLAEGLYSTRFQGRSSYIRKGKTDLALIINEGISVPTAEGSPKSSMTGIFLHKGNSYQTSLFDSRGNAYSRGCLTGPCMPGSGVAYDSFGVQLQGFNGNLYLRAAPKQQVIYSVPFIFTSIVMPVDNTYVAPRRIYR